MLDKKIYQETFSALHASEGTLKEVLKMTEQKNRRLRVRIVAAVAAAVVMVTTSAFAYVGFTQYENPAAMLQAFFGETEHTASEGIVAYDESGQLQTNIPGWERVPVDEDLAEAVLSPCISGEQDTVTCGDYTLTIEATVYDPLTHSGLAYYTLENPNGLEGYEVFPDGELWFNPETFPLNLVSSFAGKQYVDEAQSSDTRLYICEYFAAWEASDPSAFSCGLYDYAAGEDVGTCTVSLSSDEGLEGVTLAEGQIAVSPVAIRFSQSLGEARVSPRSIQYSITYIALNFEDRSQFVLEDTDAFRSNSTYRVIDNDGYEIDTFNRLVNVGNLASVTINETTYFVDG